MAPLSTVAGISSSGAGTSSFHRETIFALARSLAKIPDVGWNEVERALFVHCPKIGEDYQVIIFFYICFDIYLLDYFFLCTSSYISTESAISLDTYVWWEINFVGRHSSGLMMSMLMTIFKNSSFSDKKVACSTMLKYLKFIVKMEIALEQSARFYLYF